MQVAARLDLVAVRIADEGRNSQVVLCAQAWATILDAALFWRLRKNASTASRCRRGRRWTPLPMVAGWPLMGSCIQKLGLLSVRHSRRRRAGR